MDLQVAVVGAGHLGCHIAVELARLGCGVVLVCDSAATAAGVPTKLASVFAACGRPITGVQAAAAVSRVRATTAIAEAATAQWAIEAVSEDLAAKHSVIAQLDEVCPPSTLITSNTINFTLAMLRPAAQRTPSRLIKARFLLPVIFIPLVVVTQSAPAGDDLSHRSALQQLSVFLTMLQKRFEVKSETDQVRFLSPEESAQLQLEGQTGTFVAPDAAVHRAAAAAANMNECVICMSHPREILLRPCSHLVLCRGCAQSVTVCPMCRGNIEERIRVFGA
eukprot:TRINITY_DN7345_c0_g1_i1.p1 TRINITY_DN7345_c0_g1~~TRINITY_DN7345_c0_g1_i1.p1  ORF type:complete len:288 (+),score=59.56 TRINITY_DN7345_c0_g1_i1:33-866(+)